MQLKCNYCTLVWTKVIDIPCLQNNWPCSWLSKYLFLVRWLCKPISVSWGFTSSQMHYSVHISTSKLTTRGYKSMHKSVMDKLIA